MIYIKNKQAISRMRRAGQTLAQILRNVQPQIKVGVSTGELDRIVEMRMQQEGLKPECKGYRGYAHTTCISVNDVVVHGVPSDDMLLKDGDMVTIDVVGSYKKYCADMARTYFVGTPPPEAKRLAETTQQALDTALDMIRPGIHLSDISAAIQKVVEDAGYGVVKIFAGHGVGRYMHEDPEIPNYGTPGHGPILREGMTLAIEPMVTQHDPAVRIEKDGWTAVTRDGGLACHIEDTVVVTTQGADVLTREQTSFNERSSGI